MYSSLSLIRPTFSSAAPKTTAVPAINVLQGDIRDVDSPLRVANLFSGFTQPSRRSGAGALNEELQGQIVQAIKSGKLSGHVGETFFADKPDRNVMIIGLGTMSNWNMDIAARVSKRMVTAAAEKGYTELATILHSAGTGGIKPTHAFNALKKGVNQANKGLLKAGKQPVAVTVVTLSPDAYAEISKAV